MTAATPLPGVPTAGTSRFPNARYPCSLWRIAAAALADTVAVRVARRRAVDRLWVTGTG